MTAGEPFVPAGWALPEPLRTAQFRLAPLGPEHNESDLEAWSSSIDHIRATPGFDPRDREDAWPSPMSSDDNLADLVRHAQEFCDRHAFAYTVLAPATEVDRVIGCVYIDPDATGRATADVRCWVSASHAELDAALAGALRDWLARDWPFPSVWFPGRFGD